jgi:peptidylprolyl isomerase
MHHRTALWVSLTLATGLAGTAAIAAPTPTQAHSRAMADILAASPASDWRELDPDNTLYMDLPTGRVVIEMAPLYSPAHVANIRILAHEHYFDGLAVIRSQDNYVAQWGDPSEDVEGAVARPLGSAKPTLPAEFTVPISPKMPFTKLPDGDLYAPEVGFSNSFPVGRDRKAGQAWLTHCYGAVGVGRGNDPGSGNGASLYAITGHAPRHLDRNIAVVGRVVQGMELLSTLPRGTGPLGFYEKPEQQLPITSVKLASDVPVEQRTRLQVLRSDSATFAAVAEARRNRHDDWYVAPAGHIELCNVPIPVRAVPAK